MAITTGTQELGSPLFPSTEGCWRRMNATQCKRRRRRCCVVVVVAHRCCRQCWLWLVLVLVALKPCFVLAWERRGSLGSKRVVLSGEYSFVLIGIVVVSWGILNKSRRADTGLSDPGVIGVVADCCASSCSCPPLPASMSTTASHSNVNDLFGLLKFSTTFELVPSPSDSRSLLLPPLPLPMPALLLHLPTSCLAGLHNISCLRLFTSDPT